MKVKSKLIGLFSGLFLLSCGIVGYIGYTSATGILEEKAQERLEVQVFHTMDKIDRMLFERYMDMRFLAADPLISSSASTPEQISKRLKEFLNMNQLYLSLAFFDLKRTRRADTSGTNIGKQHPFTEYWPGIAEGREFVLLIALSETIKKVVIYSAYVVKDNKSKAIGVVVSLIAVDSLYEIIKQAAGIQSTEKELTIELVDKHGLVLYSDYDKNGILKKISDDWEAINEFVSQKKKVGSERHYHKGEDEIAAFAQEQGYLDYKGNAWILKICTPSEKAFAGIAEQRNKFLVIFAVIGFIVLLSIIYLSRAVTKPLQELNLAAAEIGKGKRDVSVRVRSEDELGQLAKAFNAMARDLQKSENKIRNIASSVGEGLYVINKNGEVTFMNPEAERLLGWTEAELLNRNIHDVVHNRKPDGTLLSLEECPMHNVIKTGIRFHSYDELFIRKDGTAFAVAVISTPLIEDGNVVSSVTAFQDITERKRIEQALRKSEERFRSLVETTSDWVWEVDEKGNYTYVSPRIRELLGYGPEEVLGKTPLDFMLPEEKTRVAAVFNIIIAQRKPFSSLENINLHKDGRLVVLETSGVPILDEAGSFKGFRGIDRDITERKRVLDSFKESEERFRRTINATQDGLWEWNIQTNQEFFAPRWCEIIGYSFDDPELPHTFDSWASRIHPEDHERVMSALKDHLEMGARYDVDYRHRHKSGEYRWQNSRGQALFDDSGKPVKMVGCITDITERKQREVEIRMLNEELESKVEERTKQLLDAQEQLIRKEKLAILGQLAGSVGHELRSPLGVMSNAVYFLQMVLTEADETTKEYLGIIKKEINNSEQIISDLLGFARTRPPQTQTTTVHELIKQSIAKCAVPENVSIQLDIPATLSVVKVDPLQMEQVFQNLVTNGIQAMPGGGELRIAARMIQNNVGAALCGCPKKGDHTGSPLQKTGDFIEISVTDTGEGISPENMKKLYQPLFTTKARGIGLGLFVSKNLTEANGGRLEVESEPGKGTTFTVILPSAGG